MKKDYFITNIQPFPDKHLWQSIFASQAYGTFFAVYINLVSTKKSSLKNIQLRSARFQLFNYKGPINLGIDKVTIKVEPSKGIIDFNIFVQALNKKTRSKKINLKKFDFSKANGLAITVNRKITPLSNKSHIKNGVFDSEYYYRDSILKPYKYKKDFLNYKDGIGRDDSENSKKEFYNLYKAELKKILKKDLTFDEYKGIIERDLSREDENYFLDSHLENFPLEAYDDGICPKGRSYWPPNRSIMI